MRDHWRRFGRDYYSRHDYESIPSTIGEDIIQRLREQLPELNGKTFGAYRVNLADNFSYQDPIDQSVSEKQGIRLIFDNGSRLVFRLSGTGTEGATLRIYLERYEADPLKHHQDSQVALADLIELAEQLCEVKKLTERTGPTVIT